MTPFTRRRAESVAVLGEERLIGAIKRWLGQACPPGAAGIGDDCAVLPAQGREVRLVTVDPVIFGRHFDATVSARQAGAKLMKRNLSDIAAMGGAPTVAVVGLILSAEVRTAWLKGFYEGMAQAALAAKTQIVGGDVAQSPATAGAFFSAHVTLLGSLAGRRALLRSGARAGDAIYVTGVLGGSLPSGHHHRFTPRLKEGQWLAARREVVAMMDVSDGLAKDLKALTPKGAVPALDPSTLPCRPGASIAQALTDGEDYELVFAVRRTRSEVSGTRNAAKASRRITDERFSRADITSGGPAFSFDKFEAAFARRFPKTRLTQIGTFVRGGRAPAGAVQLNTLHGYEHLR